MLNNKDYKLILDALHFYLIQLNYEIEKCHLSYLVDEYNNVENLYKLIKDNIDN